MTIHMKMEKLIGRIAEQCRDLDRKSIEQFLEALLEAKRVFVTGAGRSGLVGKAFAMRLMHLGFIVYVVGETTTPAVKEGDMLIAITGSGETSSIATTAKIAKEKSVRIAAITSRPESSVGKLSDVIVRIKGRATDDGERDYTARQMAGEHEPTSPLGTLFELSSMVFLDSIVAELMVRQNKSEDQMKALHTNLE